MAVARQFRLYPLTKKCSQSALFSYQTYPPTLVDTNDGNKFFARGTFFFKNICKSQKKVVSLQRFCDMAIYTIEQIPGLIPQRAPMVMIDSVRDATPQTITTTLTVLPTNILVQDGCLTEAGLIENIAQTAAAMNGCEAKKRGEAPKLGFIGEVKNFVCHRLPRVGETIQTSLTTLASMAGVTLVEAQTSCDDKPIAQAQLKIFIEE